MEITTIKETVETIHITDPVVSFARFCFNSSGDLFVSSDYGFYAYSWRSFGPDFKSFLAQSNVEYLLEKLEYTYRFATKKAIPKYWKQNLRVLIEVFINHLKNDALNVGFECHS